MNILIYFGEQLSPSNGGTERVACLLANHFVEKGIIFTTLPVGLLIQQMLLKPSFCRIKEKRRLPTIFEQ